MTEIERLQNLRQHFLSIGDLGMASEIEFQLERFGVTSFDTRLDDTPAMKERAVSLKVPAKRSR